MYLLAALALLLGGGGEIAASPRYAVDRWAVEDGLPNTALTIWFRAARGLPVDCDMGRHRPLRRRALHGGRRRSAQPPRAGAVEDRDGAMSIGVSGAGLVRWRAGVIETLTEREVSPVTTCVRSPKTAKAASGLEQRTASASSSPRHRRDGSRPIGWSKGCRPTASTACREGATERSGLRLRRGSALRTWAPALREARDFFSGTPDAVVRDRTGTAVGRHRGGTFLGRLQPLAIRRPGGQRAPSFEGRRTVGRTQRRRRRARQRSRHRAIWGGGRTPIGTGHRPLRGSRGQRVGCDGQWRAGAPQTEARDDVFDG